MNARWIGPLLRGFHAGECHSAWNHPSLARVPEVISLKSEWFLNGEAIPIRCAGKGVGENVSPPLTWTGVPDGAKELALIMEDPDAPLPKPFVHLIAYGIPPELHGLPEGSLCHEGGPLRFGKNTIGSRGYIGPRPVPAHGPHRYAVQIVALNRHPEFSSPPKLRDFLKAILGTVIGRGRLIGTFERK